MHSQLKFKVFIITIWIHTKMKYIEKFHLVTSCVTGKLYCFCTPEQKGEPNGSPFVVIPKPPPWAVVIEPWGYCPNECPC
ncbi:hypothetical protein VAE063_1010408 [Vibrio aestuarianus]|uniref:Uncharacterized protein n=1 Tax=Vibrio aestuarianus TaxID=28171 RepID=A0ABN8TKX9_9VIBR|nr:hypothetical protein VAE063_1010408 [Vibrio aestuarianus]